VKTILLGVSCVCLMFLVGCAPSIRYTRSANGETHYFVPRDWDYRKNYKVPSDRLEAVVATYIGIPYRYAGMSRRGVDCSGFVCLVFKELNRTELPHSSRKMSNYGQEVALHLAKPGDLVFFRGGLFHSIDHVGIFLGDTRFVHASVHNGVMYSSLEEPYYKKRFAEIRRIF
jgi:probable lipoprotein NlpC